MRNLILENSSNLLEQCSLPIFSETDERRELLEDIVTYEVQSYQPAWDTTIVNKQKYMHIPKPRKQVSRHKCNPNKKITSSPFLCDYSNASLEMDSALAKSQEIDFVSYLQETKSVLALAQLLDSIEHGGDLSY